MTHARVRLHRVQTQLIYKLLRGRPASGECRGVAGEVLTELLQRRERIWRRIDEVGRLDTEVYIGRIMSIE